MRTKNDFCIFKPYFLLTPEAALQNFTPKEVLINEGNIIAKDLENIEGQKHSALSQSPQSVSIERPEGYMRAFLNSPLLAVVFIKPINRNVNNDLDAE